RRGGDVLIPAFTLGRTQEVIAAIDLFSGMGVIPPGTEVYVDSPTARKITEIYRSFAEELSPWAREFYEGAVLRSSTLREVKSRTSLKVHTRNHRPSIFLSSSGDLDYANSPRHLMKMFGDGRNLLCVVGWQSPGSLGARLASGESPVLVRYRERKRFRKDWISPVLEVQSFKSFSGHADQGQLIRWLQSVRGARKVFLVHGEAGPAQALAGKIKKELGLDVEIPERGERFVIPVVAGEARSGVSAAGGVDSLSAGSDGDYSLLSPPAIN
ncbi:MAG: hypothetical protein KAX38_01940, partial [Candidatus Krumholzibacteria bacterium]|nr:hypothetical protein [Candidatus Krumholzibacteria bacterium]